MGVGDPGQAQPFGGQAGPQAEAVGQHEVDPVLVHQVFRLGQLPAGEQHLAGQHLIEVHRRPGLDRAKPRRWRKEAISDDLQIPGQRTSLWSSRDPDNPMAPSAQLVNDGQGGLVATPLGHERPQDGCHRRPVCLAVARITKEESSPRMPTHGAASA
jgi:hypothetical protein